MVGELKRLFSEGGLKDQREAGIQIEILERDGEPQDLSLLRVQLLRDGMNKVGRVWSRGEPSRAVPQRWPYAEVNGGTQQYGEGLVN